MPLPASVIPAGGQALELHAQLLVAGPAGTGALGGPVEMRRSARIS